MFLSIAPTSHPQVSPIRSTLTSGRPRRNITTTCTSTSHRRQMWPRTRFTTRTKATCSGRRWTGGRSLIYRPRRTSRPSSARPRISTVGSGTWATKRCESISIFLIFLTCNSFKYSYLFLASFATTQFCCNFVENFQKFWQRKQVKTDQFSTKLVFFY